MFIKKCSSVTNLQSGCRLLAVSPGMTWKCCVCVWVQWLMLHSLTSLTARTLQAVMLEVITHNCGAGSQIYLDSPDVSVFRSHLDGRHIQFGSFLKRYSNPAVLFLPLHQTNPLSAPNCLILDSSASPAPSLLQRCALFFCTWREAKRKVWFCFSRLRPNVVFL